MVGVAVNVTLVPSQMVVALDATLTLTGKLAFTVIVMPFEVAGLPVAHNSLEVSIQVTICPWVRPLVVNVGLLVPWVTPFTFHV